MLLGTALIHTRDRAGTWQTVRALVDSGSQISAIIVACSTRLGLRPRPRTIPISGIADTPVFSIQGVVECYIRPRFASEPALIVQAWVLPSITSVKPRVSVSADVEDRFSHSHLPILSSTSPLQSTCYSEPTSFPPLWTVGNSVLMGLSPRLLVYYIWLCPHRATFSGGHLSPFFHTSVSNCLQFLWIKLGLSKN